jgi:FAD-dependent urate hydroxylase
MTSIHRVAIAGAGVGGLTLALGLHRAGIPVSVFEKYPGAQKHATGFTLWSYSAQRLADFGFSAEKMDSVGSWVETTEIRNQAGRVISRMPVGEVSRALGAESYEVRRPQMLAAIEAELPVGTVRRGVACTHAVTEDDQAFLVLEGGERINADLVVGADGIHSTLRTVVAGPTELRDSGYRGCSAVARFSAGLLPPHTHVDLWGKGGKAGIADVGDGVVRWYLTWKAEADAQLQTREQLLAAYAEWDPVMTQVITQTADEAITHHTYADIAPIRTWRQGRVVLMGDAAHATTPFAAMGANMAIEDAGVLVEALADSDTVEAALMTFEISRKKRAEDVVAKGRIMGRVTQLHSPFAAWLRDQAFLHMPEDDTERVTREMASGD